MRYRCFTRERARCLGALFCFPAGFRLVPTHGLAEADYLAQTPM